MVHMHITHPVRQLLKTTCPPEQIAFALGRVATMPQPPQLLMSVIGLASQPLVGFLSQSMKLQVQARITALQVAPISQVRFTSTGHGPNQQHTGQRLITHPGRQLSMAACPPEQVAVALGRVATTLPQPPQLLASVMVLTSQPLDVLLSQFPKLHEQQASKKTASQSAQKGRWNRIHCNHVEL
jgi:hypothetical protein